MKSIKSIYKVGIGPSSSHTMGPSYAANNFINEYPQADHIKAILYGSLAKTGKGHGTDRAIREIIGTVSCDIQFDTVTELDTHPNTVEFFAYKDGILLGRKILIKYCKIQKYVI